MTRPILHVAAGLILVAGLLVGQTRAAAADPLARPTRPVPASFEPAGPADLLPAPATERDGGELLAQGIGGSGRSREEARKPDARLPKPVGHRSPVKAAALSLILPGAGQFYNRSDSGYIFLGVEAAGWIAWASLRSTGQDIETRYKRYADRHWSFDRYRDPNSGGCPEIGHSDGGIQDSTLVYLYDRRRDDWYEDIGKLDIYACGWDTQINRDRYRGMRDDSNSFLRNSRYALTAVFLNHLISAVHAARGAARTNARLAAGTEVGLLLSPSLVNPSARLTLSRRF